MPDAPDKTATPDAYMVQRLSEAAPPPPATPDLPKLDADGLAELERLEKSATPGPMEVVERRDDEYGELSYFVRKADDHNIDSTLIERREDAELYAALRNAAPALIAQAREASRLAAEVDQLKEALHLANGVADLAMKHRDAAEAEVERLRGALEWAFHNDPGTPVPHWVDAAVNKWPGWATCPMDDAALSKPEANRE